MRARLDVFTTSDEALFELEPEWPAPDLSVPTRPWAADDGLGDAVNDEDPLFLDEPPDLPKLEPPDTSHIDGLFADEREGAADSAPNSPALPGAMRTEARPVGRPRTAVLIAVILAGSVAGFVLAYVLLN